MMIGKIAFVFLFIFGLLLLFYSPDSFKWDKECLDGIAKDVCGVKGGEFNGVIGTAFSCNIDHQLKAFVFTNNELKLCRN